MKAGKAGGFARVAIVNRGEPAVRFLRAVHEYNALRGTRIETVALWTDPDAGAAFVRRADRAAYLGPPQVPGADGAPRSAYCDAERVIEVARRAGCDAVWPGWGFAAEDADFVERIERMGWTFLGPPSAAMRKIGDKIAAHRLARACDVPLPPSVEITGEESGAELRAAAEQVGYPLLVKAAAGGGGRGIRRVDAPEALEAAVRQAAAEARRAFGGGGLLLEACIEGARHIEVQFAAGPGPRGELRAVALGLRDCSLQRRRQKVIEEAPPPAIDAAAAERARASAERLAVAAGYQGVGTAEFLYVPGTGALYFLEVNARLQVEHTITELVTGIDLVHLQLDLARGLPLELTRPDEHGCAIEARLNAENPEEGFRPSPGRLRLLRLPAGPGVRVDAGVSEGDVIPAAFDSMIAKVMAWAPTRALAIARLRRALRELAVVVEDGATNKAFLLELLDAEPFTEATADVSWIDREVAAGRLRVRDGEAEAVAMAAIVEERRARIASITRFFQQVHRGMPRRLPEPTGKAMELRVRGSDVPVRVHAVGPGRFALEEHDGHIVDVCVERTGEHSCVLSVGSERHDVLFARGRAGVFVEVDGRMHLVEPVSGGLVRAPAPALVVDVAVEEGQTVRRGDRLCTLEAMKMESDVRAEVDGVVRAVHCRAGQHVVPGQPLVAVRPAREQAGGAGGETRRFAGVALTPLAGWTRPSGEEAPVSPATSARLAAEAARWAVALFAGWDVPQRVRERLADLVAWAASAPSLPAAAAWWQAVATVEAFADVHSLFERGLVAVEGEGVAVSADVWLHEFFRRHHEGADAVPPAFAAMLERALRWSAVRGLDPSSALREALWRLAVAREHRDDAHRLCSALLRLAIRLHRDSAPVEEHFVPARPGGSEAGLSPGSPGGNAAHLRRVLDRIAQVADPAHAAVIDNARQALYVLFEQRRFVAHRTRLRRLVRAALAGLEPSDVAARRRAVADLVGQPHALVGVLLELGARADAATASVSAEVAVRRLYRGRALQRWTGAPVGAHAAAGTARAAPPRADEGTDGAQPLVWGFGAAREADAWLGAVWRRLARRRDALVELFATADGAGGEALVDAVEGGIVRRAGAHARRVALTWVDAAGAVRHRTWRRDDSSGALVREAWLDDVHPEAARRMELWRLEAFELERLESSEYVVAFHARARENPRDERIFVFAEIRTAPAVADDGALEDLWEFERAYYEGLRVIREEQAKRERRRRFYWNRMTFFVRPVLKMGPDGVARLARHLAPAARGAGLQKVVIRVNLADPSARGGTRVADFVVSMPGRHRLEVRLRRPPRLAIRPMTPYEMQVVRARRMGLVYPYEIVRMLEGGGIEGQCPHPDMERGQFVEYDLDPTGERLVPVDRPRGHNEAGVVVGVVRNFTDRYPEGMERVWIGSDPTRAMGALAEPECRRIVAALDLAAERGVPVEWVAVSAGARIAFDSGTENLDWTARVLRRLVEFADAGGEVNVIVPGINVGAQSYWNAEATMLMHCKGLLVMTADGSMVLTGRKALEVSGSVSADDERDIGGFAKVMGPNGEAALVAPDLGAAYARLFEHYRFTYRMPGEVRPRPWPTTDAADRNVLEAPYEPVNGEPFERVGDIFDARHNPDRKKPFAIRQVMRALVDADGGWLERWAALEEGETAVVWDAFVGGEAVALIGIESRPLPRRGTFPLDGPESWTGGTLFPHSSRKVARAIYQASGRRPVVVLANLSGFDGSPESMRKRQLEYGAEIGRAVVRFEGPLIFAVIGRYHGGAYVVFSKALNPGLEALALEGSYASVIGGAPAAAVVFARQVRAMVEADERVARAREALRRAPPAERPRLREELDALVAEVTAAKRADVARRFDSIHTVERAVRVGSLDAVIPPHRLRPAIVAALRRHASPDSPRVHLAPLVS